MSDTNTSFDDLTTAEIVDHALQKWVELTGVSMGQTSFRLGDLDVHSMNESMKDALKLEPEGTTAYLLLECFLREYLENKTFTVASIMKDYARTSAYLKQAEELFSIVQSERALELASAFRSRVKQGVAHYNADREDVLEMIDHPDILPFLRRDALHSLEVLKPYQFLSGEAGTGPAQVIEHVYQAWNINDLLASLRDMPVSGIAVVLLRDPSHPERSYFAFAMRNGGNVILFTDRNKPAYPGQEDNMRSRGQARAFMSRAWENHFPYHLIKTELDEKGDAMFLDETAPVAAGLDLVPLMRIRDLPHHQVIWLTMMLSLISDKFWHKKWQADALSYTGAMVQNKSLLVTDESGNNLPVAQGYAPIALEEVEVAEITAEALNKQLDKAGARGINEWLEKRYRDRVPKSVVNQWTVDADTTLMLTANPDPEKDRGRKTGTEISPEVMAVKKMARMTPWQTPRGYKLQSFSETEFGTEEELRNDRLWIARYNFAEHIQKSADAEFGQRKDEVAKWYYSNLERNLPNLIDMIAEMAIEIDGGKDFWGDRLLTFADFKSSEWDYIWSTENAFGEFEPRGNKRRCIITDAIATYRARFTPRTAEQLAQLCGCGVSGLPDVLQNWKKDKEYVGNSILQRLDPMDAHVEDPWLKLPVTVNIFLSKRALAKAKKDFSAKSPSV